VLVSLMDITERRRDGEELRQAKDELELRVRERTAELQAANAELTRSNQELEQFAYVSSHDLQEPLRMVASYVGLLEVKYKDKLDKDAHTYISYAADGAKRMQTLILDLLEYSRVRTRGQTPTITDGEEVLTHTLNNLKIAIQECNAQVTHGPMPRILADEIQLGQVFQNLIENALKFRKTDQPPQIHITAQQKDGQWLFKVKDNGIGVAPENHERIFTIFQRLHARSQYPGNGIGLAIVRQIVERHGGQIWVESGLGEGSTFYFMMPMVKYER
jgi:light-regulated signal transduction histidine kinase (bacteriophytochrome)